METRVAVKKEKIRIYEKKSNKKRGTFQRGGDETVQ